MDATYLVLIALVVAVVGGFTDVRSGKVYNILTYPAAGLGLVLQTASSGTDGLVFGVGGLLVGLGILLIPYLLGFVGGGDVKLLAAVGTFIGPRDTASVMLFGAAFGGLLAIVLLLKRRELVSTALQLAFAPRQTLGAATLAKGDFPFATTVPLGLIAAFGIQRLVS
jgi:prepilin peptidase CpaA